MGARAASPEKKFRPPLLRAFALCLLTLQAASAAEFGDEFERDYSLRTIGRLQTSNLRGSIIVQGWSQEKIRVRVRRRVTADDPAGASRLLAAADIRYRSIEGDIELAAEYGRGLDIEGRLRERRSSRVRMDLTVFAPSSLALNVLTAGGDIGLRDWTGAIELRGQEGSLQVRDVRSPRLAVVCPGCEIHVERSRGGVLRVSGVEKGIDLQACRFDSVFVETRRGSIQANAIESPEQIYVSGDGPMRLNDLRGRIEFHSQAGSVDIRGLMGTASGATRGGSVKLQAKTWDAGERALVESDSGNLLFSLPSSFSGEIDLQSEVGRVATDFAWAPIPSSRGEAGAVRSSSRIQGRIGRRTELLRLFSRSGAVELKRTPGVMR
jgi:hypothetical protein